MGSASIATKTLPGATSISNITNNKPAFTLVTSTLPCRTFKNFKNFKIKLPESIAIILKKRSLNFKQSSDHLLLNFLNTNNFLSQHSKKCEKMTIKLLIDQNLLKWKYHKTANRINRYSKTIQSEIFPIFQIKSSKITEWMKILTKSISWDKKQWIYFHNYKTKIKITKKEAKLHPTLQWNQTFQACIPIQTIIVINWITKLKSSCIKTSLILTRFQRIKSAKINKKW